MLFINFPDNTKIVKSEHLQTPTSRNLIEIFGSNLNGNCMYLRGRPSHEYVGIYIEWRET